MPSNVVKLGSPNIVPLNTSNVFFIYTSMRATIVNLATVSSQTVATSVRLTTHAPTQSRSKPDDKTYKTWQWSPSSCTFLSATITPAVYYTTLRACTQCRSHNRFSRREALLCESFNQSNIQWTMISVNRATTVVLVT